MTQTPYSDNTTLHTVVNLNFCHFASFFDFVIILSLSQCPFYFFKMTNICFKCLQ